MTLVTATAILSLIKIRDSIRTYFLPFKCLTIFESDNGGLEVLDDTNLLKIVLQKADSVRLLMKRYNFTSRW